MQSSRYKKSLANVKKIKRNLKMIAQLPIYI